MKWLKFVLKNKNLHSNKLRLKQIETKIKKNHQAHLHSNKLRLKHMIELLGLENVPIYIPISWD